MSVHRRRYPPAVVALSLAGVLFGLSAREAHADAREFRPDTNPPPARLSIQLPIELALGNARSNWHVGPAATTDVALLPGLRWDRLSLNAVFRGMYLNPRGDFALGGRAGYDLLVLDGLIPIRPSVDVSYLTVHPGLRVALGAQFGLGTLGSVGVWSGRDWVTDRWFVNLALLVDLAKLGDPIGAILELTPTKDQPHG